MEKGFGNVKEKNLLYKETQPSLLTSWKRTTEHEHQSRRGQEHRGNDGYSVTQISDLKEEGTERKGTGEGQGQDHPD